MALPPKKDAPPSAEASPWSRPKEIPAPHVSVQMGNVPTVGEGAGQPNEASKLLPSAQEKPQGQPDWGVRRIAQLAYHAAFIVLSIYFFVHIYKGRATSDHSTGSEISFRSESRRPYGAEAIPGTTQLKPFIIHTPKTASNYYLELIRYVCKDVPVYDTITDLVENNPDGVNVWIDGGALYGCMSQNFSKQDMWHTPVDGEQWVRFSGSFVAMFRDPTSRLASGFAHDFHSCKAMDDEYYHCLGRRRLERKSNPSNWKRHWLHDLSPEEKKKCMLIEEPNLAIVKQYFDCVKGCAANMLVGVRCGDGGYWYANGVYREDPYRPNYEMSDKELQVALARLEQMAAIGIMEEYAESVARLYQKFGGGALPFDESSMLPNVRPGSDSDVKSNARAILIANGLVDVQDETIYKRAKEMFDVLPNVIRK